MGYTKPTVYTIKEVSITANANAGITTVATVTA